MVEETASGDDRAADGLAHLQAAARELIAAARAILDVAEDLVEDPKTVTALTDALGTVVRSAAQVGRQAAGAAGSGSSGAGGDGIERIRVD